MLQCKSIIVLFGSYPNNNIRVYFILNMYLLSPAQNKSIIFQFLKASTEKIILNQ